MVSGYPRDMTDLFELVRAVIDRYDEHDILTYASALAYKVLFAITPLLLFGLGLAGALGFEERWSRDWAPRVKDAVSPPVFQVIDDAARRALTGEQKFWITAGLVLAVWAISGAARAIMDVFDRIYSVRRERSYWERMAVSLALGLGVTVLVLAAIACVTLAPVPAWIRWPAAAALLIAVDALLVTFAPAERQPLHWITAGTALSVGAWLVTSLALGWYATSVAEYGNVYGALATFVILLTYLYFAAASFLTGVELDDLLRDGATAPTARRAA
jgi:membrane protein